MFGTDHIISFFGSFLFRIFCLHYTSIKYCVYLIDETAAAENNLNQEERMLIVHRLHEVLRPFVLRRVKAQVLDQVMNGRCFCSLR